MGLRKMRFHADNAQIKEDLNDRKRKHCKSNPNLPSCLNKLAAAQCHLSLVMKNIWAWNLYFPTRCLHPAKQIYVDTDKVYFSLMYLMTFYNQHCSHYKESFEFLRTGIYTKSEWHSSKSESYRIYYSSVVVHLNKGIMHTLKKIRIQGWLLIQVSSNLFHNTVCNGFRQCNIWRYLCCHWTETWSGPMLKQDNCGILERSGLSYTRSFVLSLQVGGKAGHAWSKLS